MAVADINDAGGRETVDLIRQAGGEAFHQHCDVSQTDQVQVLVRETCERFAGLHVLLNHAAYMDIDGRAPTTEISEAAQGRSLSVTLTGAYLCSKYAIPHMSEEGGGSIVSIASVVGLVAFDSQATYCSATAGLVMLMKSIAHDYG